MIFKCDCEFRGSSCKTNEKGNYYYISLETSGDDGEAIKLPSVDYSEFLKNIKKGDQVSAFIEYSPKYSSLKVVDIKKLNGNTKV